MQKMFVGIALLLSPLISNALPCGTSASGLNVGVIADNLPWNGWNGTTNSAVGFDPLLITAAAKLLGYNTVNFIGYENDTDALADLAAGIIDVLADSSLRLDKPPIDTMGIVTDIAALSVRNQVFGWQVDLRCCQLALELEAAVTQLVANGTYARILQLLRLNNLTNGLVLGMPKSAFATGILQEPFDFASSEIGTIATGCVGADPSVGVVFPQTNCISAYLQAACTPATTFTGATGSVA